VDGIPHLVLGPAGLVFSPSIADLLGVSLGPLVLFLTAFTLYGSVVLAGLARAGGGRVAPWLRTTALTANIVLVVAVAGSLLYVDVTTLGIVVHVVALVSGVVVTSLLALLPLGASPTPTTDDRATLSDSSSGVLSGERCSTEAPCEMWPQARPPSFQALHPLTLSAGRRGGQLGSRPGRLTTW